MRALFHWPKCIGCGLSRVLPLLAGMLLASTPAGAEPLLVVDAWARAMPPNITTGAVYLGICNPGNETVVVRRVQTPVAEKAELHQHVTRDSVLSMQAIAELPVAAGTCRQLRPGRDHLMLFGLKLPLQAGQQYPLSLELSDGYLLHTRFSVIGPGTVPPGGASTATD